MSLLEDLFGEDDLLGDPGELETIEEERIENEGEQNEEEKTGTKVEVKKRIIRNPQPKLNADRLRGPRGIATLESQFKDIKFKGKGHEKEDLKKVLRKLEHWCHRLYPKFQFDDCVDRIEKLGSKKVVQTYLRKIRLGMVDIDVEMDNLQGQKDEDEVLPPEDEFDQLLDQQIAEINDAVIIPNTQEEVNITKEMQERMIRNRELAQQKLLAKQLARQQQIMEYESTLNQQEESVQNQENLNPNLGETDSVEPMESEVISISQAKSSSQQVITEEQAERMERNRQLAIQKRLEKLKKLEEQNTTQNNDCSSTAKTSVNN